MRKNRLAKNSKPKKTVEELVKEYGPCMFDYLGCQGPANLANGTMCHRCYNYLLRHSKDEAVSGNLFERYEQRLVMLSHTGKNIVKENAHVVSLKKQPSIQYFPGNIKGSRKTKKHSRVVRGLVSVNR